MINDKEYWNNRFEDGSWSKNNGEKQSAFFYQILYENLPNWLINEIEKVLEKKLGL